MTQKIEKDVNAASATIDMLCMLREKTKGNLSKYEEDILANSISSLQMNYVDETEKEEEKAEDGEQKTEDGEQKTEDGEQKAEDGEQKTEK
jgi:sorbitol-specific phosphotransferase system component IIBC